MVEEISWSKLFRYRDMIHKRYPEIWSLKILRKRFPFILNIIKDGEKVLDIGASDRGIESRLKRHFPNLIYKSLDVDHETFQDFYSIDDIKERFDVIFLFEVIEHLSLEEGIKLLKSTYNLLNPKGRLILTTPNIFNPGRFWRDATHRQAYCYDELGGLILAQGFEVKEIYRTYSDAFHRYIFRVYFMAPIHRYLGIDFAKSILILAEKRHKDENYLSYT